MAEAFSTASISLQTLSKHFDEVKAVDDVSLEVQAGTLVCLLGPSGCGKTTTLRMIAGFEEPTAGRIFIGDEDITNIPPYTRPTAMVFQSYALFPHMSVQDNIAYGLRARRTPKAEIGPRVQEAVALMELQGQEKKAPPQLSGGQQQRVALARALVTRMRNCASACVAKSERCSANWALPAYMSLTTRKKPSASLTKWPS